MNKVFCGEEVGSEGISRWACGPIDEHGTDRTDKLHFRVSGGIRQSRITVLLSSRARAGRAGRRFRRTFFDARR